jgi:hypothetical protein
LSRWISNIVDVTFVVCFSTKAWNSHGCPFELFSVETLRFLLSSDISDLLTKEAFVGATMTTVVMRRPKFIVRLLSAWVI